MMASTVRLPMAPRKDFGVLAVNDVHHIAAAYTYGRLCSAKRLALAWGVRPATARKYRLGTIVGALTRICWEVALLERHGINTAPIWALVRRVALRERRCWQATLARRV